MGEKGGRGPRGPRGEKGMIGDAGRNEPEGIAIKGDQGDPGRDGLKGMPGPDGIEGYSGGIGPKYVTRLLGMQGARGVPAVAARRPPSRGFFFTYHSQTDMVPSCPQGSSELWNGYSLLWFTENHKSHNQDLGAPGSCLRVFSTMPFLFCQINNVCNYASEGGYSYWLSTTEPMTKMMTPIPAYDLPKYISRCVVCEAPTRVIAVHSQSLALPECPNQWEELWTGYSFLMHTGSGAQGGGQSLVSPGSCLHDFRASPFIECHGDGKCNYYHTSTSFWLATIEDREMFRKPRSQTLKGGDLRTRVSRCKVCIRGQVRRQIAQRGPQSFSRWPRSNNDEETNN
ncbi:unnamed protein product [Nesidiocoris tenuis]|uniref:Collagen IV NC1 domain-containing protein n=1 Tax=Nesidiocoris tenuis TaxID=355587 RepID=A0A6H5H5D4_9HEMI|nr:unnamed protein product [Nesidiocoris tenuis]